jgi:hypothetical protein
MRMRSRLAGCMLVVAACGSVNSNQRSDDAAVFEDAPAVEPDAPPGPPLYDAVYGSTWEFNVNQAVPGWIAIANTSDDTLDLTTLEIIGVEDDHPTMNLTAVLTADARPQLPFGMAAGELTPVTQRVTVDAGLLPEVRIDTGTTYLTFDLLNFDNAAEVTFAGAVTIAIEGRRAKLPMTFHVTPLNGGILFEPSLGKRVRAP